MAGLRGWAIDLFLGEITRPHEDLEIGVFRRDQVPLRAQLTSWDLYKSARPGAWDPWEDDEWLEIPIHQLLARPAGSGPLPDPWEPQSEELQFFLLELEDGFWVSRRDERLRRPVEEISFLSEARIPAVAPEIQLLYKAKHHLDKDEHDFELTAKRLQPEQRRWLRRALELVHPGDPWLERLRRL
jgi:hypothetical protein